VKNILDPSLKKKTVTHIFIRTVMHQHTEDCRNMSRCYEVSFMLDDTILMSGQKFQLNCAITHDFLFSYNQLTSKCLHFCTVSNVATNECIKILFICRTDVKLYCYLYIHNFLSFLFFLGGGGNSEKSSTLILYSYKSQVT
jgi:hypothetical protein